jgi:hypothetical protein
MNLRTKLIGVLEPVTLSLTVALMIALLAGLLDPMAQRQNLVPQVIVTQLDADATRYL